ncbi:MAG: DNA-binding transcriptional LysR family regulator [Paracoccaceae bacterium]|jgi:DNA-binding transcriptional LysR family regulator
MKHLQIYHAFKLIVREGSIRKASEIMGISASSLNRQISAFEAELNTELFDRKATGVRLTVAGEIYYRQFIEHIARLEGARKTVVELQGGSVGLITVAVTGELVQGFLPSQIQQYRQMFPRVRFKMVPVLRDNVDDLLNRYEADIAVVVQPEMTGKGEVLCIADMAVCALRAHKEPVRLQDFVTNELILPDPSLGVRVVLDLFARRRRLTLRAAVESTVRIPSVLMSPTALQFWLREDVCDHTPVQSLAHLGNPTARVAVIQRGGHSLSIAATRFVSLLSRNFEQIGVSGQ